MMEIHNMMDFHHMVDIHHMMKFHHMMGFHHFVFSLWNQFQLWKNIMHWRSFSFRDELGEATVCGIHRLTDADDDQHGVDNQAASADGDPSVGWNMLQLLFKSESLYNYFRCCNCKRKQSLLHDTVLSNSNTTLRDFVLLMYQFCNSHRTYDTVTKETCRRTPSTSGSPTSGCFAWGHRLATTTWRSIYICSCGWRAEALGPRPILGSCCSGALPTTVWKRWRRQPKGRRSPKPRSSLMRRTRMRRIQMMRRTRTQMTTTLSCSTSTTALAARPSFVTRERADLLQHVTFCESL